MAWIGVIIVLIIILFPINIGTMIVVIILSLPLMVGYFQFISLVWQERKKAKQLTKAANLLPNDIDNFNHLHHIEALRILDEAQKLPSMLPSDVDGVVDLWEKRHKLRG